MMRVANNSTINLTWTGPGSNPDLRCAKPLTNRLSQGTAQIWTHPHHFVSSYPKDKKASLIYFIIIIIINVIKKGAEKF
jgi:hypothetical protein